MEYRYLKKTPLKTTYLTLIVAFVIGFSSCSQDEGFGGNSNIKGTIIEQFYNDDYSLLLAEKPAKDEDVFLHFGNASTFGEKISTSLGGDFNFMNLWPGDYSLYYYQPDSNNPELGDEEVLFDIKLSKGETYELGNLYLKRVLEWNEGTAAIEGKVMLTNYKNSSEWPNLIVKDISPAQDYEVFLVYENHPVFDERIRTHYDGTFRFNNLILGKYTIYVYSEDVTGATEKKVVLQKVTIENENQVIPLETMQIEKL